MMTIRTPWKPRSVAERGREYLGMVSYFRLRGTRVLPAFALNMLRIERQLDRSEGHVGHSGGARLRRLEFWSVSVWEDEEALQGFLHARPHVVEVMRVMRPAVVRSEFVRWLVDGSSVPPDPEEAEKRLRLALAAGDGHDD